MEEASLSSGWVFPPHTTLIPGPICDLAPKLHYSELHAYFPHSPLKIEPQLETEDTAPLGATIPLPSLNADLVR